VWSTQQGELVNTLDAGVGYSSLDLFRNLPYTEMGSLRTGDVHFSPDATQVAAVFDDGVVRVWSLALKGLTAHLLARGADLIAFSNDSKQIVTGANDGTARVWSLSPPADPVVFRYPKSVYAAAMSADGQIVASGSSDGVTHLWRFSNPSDQVELKGIDATIKGVAFNKLGTQVATSHSNGVAMLWDITNWNAPVSVRQFKGSEGMEGIQFSPDGLKLLAWAKEAAYLWAVDGSNVTVLPSNHGNVWHAEYSPNGSRVVTSYDDGAVYVWNADGSGKFAEFKGHTGTTFRAVFSPDGTRLLTVSKDGSARLWSSDGSGTPTVLPGANTGKDWLENCAFSPDGKKFVVTSGRGRAWVWPADGRGEPLVLHSISEELRSISDLAHIASITSVSFSADSKRIVTTGGLDGMVHVWQADSIGQSVALAGHEGTVTWATFSKDGSRVITASEDGTVRLWRIGWHDLVLYLTGLTSASLTEEERIILLGESETEARAAYEAAERHFGRTPLPKNWQFVFPF
jgi:WD40 repeat protein